MIEICIFNEMKQVNLTRLFISVSFLILTASSFSHGVCEYNGLFYQEHAMWHTRDCQVCTCTGGIPICDRMICKDPICHKFNEDLRLPIDGGSCCPTCSNRKSCFFKGKLKLHEDEWIDDCQSCHCDNGIIRCEKEKCRYEKCGRNQIEVSQNSSCCIKCSPKGNTCEYNGKSYQDMDTWKVSKCTACSCINGFVQCFVARCPAKYCPKGQKLAYKDDSCCPHCTPTECFDENNKSYKHGDIWKKDKCIHCKCDSGQILCSKKVCDKANQCLPGYNLITRNESCCSECVAVKKNCKFRNQTFYHRDMWNVSSCNFCSCDDGKISCKKVKCPKAICLSHERKVHISGKCCPECVINHNACHSGDHMYEVGELWLSQGCNLKSCEYGETRHYVPKCSTCAVGWEAKFSPQSCCPTCIKSNCNKMCAKCLKDQPNHCLTCSDKNLKIQEGKCVTECSIGFFNTGISCQRCHHSCLSCFGPSEHQCYVCHPKLMMENNVCVKHCSEGFYLSNHTCVECNMDCKSCSPSKPDFCKSCDSDKDVILNGKCNSACDKGMFVNNHRQCEQCSDKCILCENKSRCKLCAPGNIIQDGYCKSDCSSGFYKWDEHLCKACHHSCSDCHGPTAKDCNDCHKGLVKSNGVCRSSCPIGFFNRRGDCKVCHSSCLNCVGPALYECTECVNPAHALNRFPLSNYGRCDSKCPRRSFKNIIRVCQACHKNCLFCYGPNDNDCTSCLQNFHLHGNRCLASCPSETYSMNGICKKCAPQCLSCDGLHQCKDCKTGFNLSNGKCMSKKCQLGQYFMTRNGQCKKCHSTCAECVMTESGTVACAECKNKNHYINGYKCVSRCGLSNFVDSSRLCKRCHSSCLECSTEHPNGCSKCSNNLVLTPDSSCHSVCPDGYFNETNVCKECPSSCSKCLQDGKCLKCTGNKVLQLYQCVDQCHEQFFHDEIANECKECSRHCKSCNGPLSNNCTSCLAPKVLQNGLCISKCDSGYYNKDNMCKECPSNCDSCIDSSSCLLCKSKYFLFQNVCLQFCPVMTFSNLEARKCSKCGHGCQLCESSDSCITCSSNWYLFDGKCVQNCPNTHYHSRDKNVCILKEEIVMTIYGAIGEIGRPIVLDSNVFNLVDSNLISFNGFSSIKIKLLSIPNAAKIWAISNGQKKFLLPLSIIPFSSFSERKIFFQQESTAVVDGELKFQAGYHSNFSRVYTVPITLKSSFPPVVVDKGPVVIATGEEIILSSNVIDIYDEDNLKDVELIIRSGPENGTLSLLGKFGISKFKFDEIDKGSLIYKHIQGYEDAITFIVDDGNNREIISIIFMVLPMSLSPMIVNNIALPILYGETTLVHNNVLKAVDAKNSGNELKFVFKPSSAGKFILNSEDKKTALVSEFLQSQVDIGMVSFHHIGSQNNFLKLSFKVIDMKNPTHVLYNQSFNILVISKNIAPVPSNSSSFSITVSDKNPIILTSKMLHYLDENYPSELQYNIIDYLPSSFGYIHYTNTPSMPLQSFTQEDINRYRIKLTIYEATNVLSSSFTFKVSDGESSSAMNKFSIEIHPHTSQLLSKIHKEIFLRLLRGGIEQVQKKWFASEVESVGLVIITAPIHGSLVLKKSHDNEYIGPGAILNNNDVLAGNYYYVHDGMNLANDSIHLIAIHNGQERKITVNFQIRADAQLSDLIDTPFELPTIETISVNEGSTILLSAETFKLMNNEKKSKLCFKLISKLYFGKLEKMVSSNQFERVFSNMSIKAEEIEAGIVRYVANLEIGDILVEDLVSFEILEDNIRLGNHLIAVKILPLNNIPPAVMVTDEVPVKEGQSVVISQNIINVLDPDSNFDDLLVIVDVNPVFGIIEDFSTGVSPAYQFTLKSLAAGKVQYRNSRNINKEAVKDSMIFHINDGVANSSLVQLNFTIELINDEAPILITDFITVPTPGSSVVVRNTSIYVSDADTDDEDISIQLTKAPKFGMITLIGFMDDSPMSGIVLNEGESFSYEDLLNELIVYNHLEMSSLKDSVSISASDGTLSSMKTIEIRIQPSAKKSPVLVHNTGLTLFAGSSAYLTTELLSATDSDSNDKSLTYSIREDVDFGRLVFDDRFTISTEGPITSFSQQDLEDSKIKYQHNQGEPSGVTSVKFNLTDPEGITSSDQTFIINVIKDVIPPEVTVNRGLRIKEGLRSIISTNLLSSTDNDSEPAYLKYIIVKGTNEGEIRFRNQVTSEFTQADIAAGLISYVHTSTKENIHSDHFEFIVSDGVNSVKQKFLIDILPVNDRIPSVILNDLRVQEGVSKTISEYELLAEDLDSKPEELKFVIMQSPKHGVIQLVDKDGNLNEKVFSFTMQNVFDNQLKYRHDGSDTLQDSILMSVSDGSNNIFTLNNKKSDVPFEFKINILPVDDGMPFVVENKLLPYLNQKSVKEASNIISNEYLKTVDDDTSPDRIKYIITKLPAHGFLEKASIPNKPINEFYQSEINSGSISYHLTDFSGSATEDKFEFEVSDSKPNIVRDNVFHIKWSFLSFLSKFHYVNETEKFISLAVKKIGNLRQYSIVSCATKSGSAKSDNNGESIKNPDFIPYSNQIQFDAWEDEKMCRVEISDDTLFEGPEVFSVELTQPIYSIVLEPHAAYINIVDYEDYPVINLEKNFHRVEESADYVDIGMQRSGDLSRSISVLCYTRSGSAMGTEYGGVLFGSDYISRPPLGSSWIHFGHNEAKKDCRIKIINDDVHEEDESFQVVFETKGNVDQVVHVAEVIIDGPNDESEINFKSKFMSVLESDSYVNLTVFRSGPDLTAPASVWCGTKQSNKNSAIPGEDFVETFQKIVFMKNQTKSICMIKLLDDEVYPVYEKNKTISVYLRSPENTKIGSNSDCVVLIQDTDIPVIQFTNESISVNENDLEINVPISRSGDLSIECSIICFTEQANAKSGIDFEERIRTSASKVSFKPNQMTAMCNVQLIDDSEQEPEEKFKLKLAKPTYPAIIGIRNVIQIRIKNAEDVPKIYFDQQAYQILEPAKGQRNKKLVIKVNRIGDIAKRAKFRVSTRDGSAKSGKNYHAKSRNMRFKPGEWSKRFEVSIIRSTSSESRNTLFRIVIENQGLVNLVLGNVTSTSVTIISPPKSGSNIIPAPPVVVSVLDLMNKAISRSNPPPGFPLICLTICDPEFSKSKKNKNMCDNLKINATNIRYRWEVAIPTHNKQMSRYERISDSTVFASSKTKSLDPLFFAQHFKIRCSAQVQSEEGLGLRVWSKGVIIDRKKSTCQNAVVAGFPRGVNSRKFISSLSYKGATDPKYPNHLHIYVEIPHEDGMVPIISTTQINNINAILTNPIYRQQHVCSNLGTYFKSNNRTNYGFLPSFKKENSTLRSEDVIYRMNKIWSERQSYRLYKHLNVKSCTWIFEAFYDVSDIVDICHGSVLSDFEIRNKGQSYLTVQVPLFISYIHAMGPTGWSTIDHQTKLEFSFYYNTVLWRSGVQLNENIKGSLQVLRTRVNEEGKLSIDFKTKAKFRGKYVINHRTLPKVKSLVKAPLNLKISFKLIMLWSEQTVDGPVQLWRATSDYSLKDYSGQYSVQLIPCIVNAGQSFLNKDGKPMCTARKLQTFTIPIVFQQISRPIPVIYSLNTDFYLTNNKNAFLANSSSLYFFDDFKGAFSEGDLVFGKVSWNPDQNLQSAYKLSIDKVFLCTGKDGKIPTYDPTGKIYNEGPQYGCIQSSSSLKHRFVLLDRSNHDERQELFKDKSFEAQFADSTAEHSTLVQQNGVDGFSFQIDPLYLDESGNEWFIQVMYTIGAHDRNRGDIRSKRSIISKFKNDMKNGTNMHYLRLNAKESSSKVSLTPIVSSSIGVFLVFVTIIVILFVRKRLSSQSPAAVNAQTTACNSAQSDCDGTEV